MSSDGTETSLGIKHSKSKTINCFIQRESYFKLREKLHFRAETSICFEFGRPVQFRALLRFAPVKSANYLLPCNLGGEHFQAYYTWASRNAAASIFLKLHDIVQCVATGSRSERGEPLSIFHTNTSLILFSWREILTTCTLSRISISPLPSNERREPLISRAGSNILLTLNSSFHSCAERG